MDWIVDPVAPSQFRKEILRVHEWSRRSFLGRGRGDEFLETRIVSKRIEHRIEPCQRGGLVLEAHIGQREISDEEIFFRLFFEARFQFAARLPPTFLGGGMVADDLFRPTYPTAQLAVDET